MEGYSVTEAASVLGVPTERIWELLARGVLAGAPEGETGMRVFLQPRPAPAQPEARGPNGHGAEPEREMSPFRELLTEFRNLTERYGQALLALGESRGEVAALRSRVDLLEARMDLRLPGGASSWASPSSFPVEHAVIPTAPEPATSTASVPTDDELAEERAEEERRHRARGPRRATESFAEALARAEDPSPAELPHGPEAVLERETDEAALPREVPVADAVLVADEVDDAADVEPLPVSEAVPDLEPVREAEPVAEPEPLVEADEPERVELEPEPVELESEPGDLEPEPEPVLPEESREASVEAADEPAYAAVADASAAAEDDRTATVEEGLDAWSTPDAAEGQPTDEPATSDEAAEAAGMVAVADEHAVETAEEGGEAEEDGSDAMPLEWDADRYTTAIDEPDWFEAEIEERSRATFEPVAPAPEPAPAPPIEPEPEPPADRAEEPSAEKETVLWHGSSVEPSETSGAADETGVDATSAEVASTPPEPTGPAPLPGAAELDQALDALRRQAIQASDDDGDEWPPGPLNAGTSRPSGVATQPSARPPLPTRAGMPAVTPAGRAYRRLRRIFPG